MVLIQLKILWVETKDTMRMLAGRVMVPLPSTALTIKIWKMSQLPVVKISSTRNSLSLLKSKRLRVRPQQIRNLLTGIKSASSTELISLKLLNVDGSSQSGQDQTITPDLTVRVVTRRQSNATDSSLENCCVTAQILMKRCSVRQVALPTPSSGRSICTGDSQDQSRITSPLLTPISSQQTWQLSSDLDED